jgi:hypothetical protein
VVELIEGRALRSPHRGAAPLDMLAVSEQEFTDSATLVQAHVGRMRDGLA